MNQFEQEVKEWERKRDYECRKSQSNIAFIVAGVFGVGGIGPGIVIPTSNGLPIGPTIGIICGLIALTVLPLLIGIYLRKLAKKEEMRVFELEKKYGKDRLFNAVMSERSLNASVRALSDTVKRTVFTHSQNGQNNSNNSASNSYSSGSRESFYDSRGILRKPDENYFDYSDTLRRPDESYIDGKGIMRKPGENYFDGKGILRKPEDSYFDSQGNFHNK